MSNQDPLLERNPAFAATDARERLAGMMRPRHPVMIITCLDPRVDPSAGLGLQLGCDQAELAREAVSEPGDTVQTDVARLLAAPQISPRIRVSGHVDELETGLISTIVRPAAPTGRPA